MVYVGTHHIARFHSGNAIAVFALLLAACCRSSFALNPSLDINQYAHTAWTIREGRLKGAVFSIAQTADGYLWLGTEFGVVRFDGVRFADWQPPKDQRLPSTFISKLLAARDGTVWIGTDNGLASWNNGNLTVHPEFAGFRIFNLREAPDGTLWVGADALPTARICGVRKGSSECYGQDGVFGSYVQSLYTRDGEVWALTQSGLWRLAAGALKRYPISGAGRDQALNETPDGRLIVVTAGGIKEVVGDNLQPYTIPGKRPDKPVNILRDRDGGLWIGTAASGLLHLHAGRTDRFARSDGLTGDYVLTFFEDREGNIWVGTTAGLDKFRDFVVTTVSSKQGLSGDYVWSVLASRDGNVWIGEQNALNLWRNGRITIFQKQAGLPDPAAQSILEGHDGRLWAFTSRGLVSFEHGKFTPVTGVAGGRVHAMAGDSAGNLWLSEDRGLLHLRDGRIVEDVPWSRLGAKRTSLTLLASPEPGGVWIGSSLDSGIIYFKDGEIRQSYQANGLAEGKVGSLSLDRDGALWAATAGGLSRIKNGHVATLNSRNGLPCDSVHWLMVDDDDSFWLYMPCGLVRIPRPELDAWTADPKRTVQTSVFDSADGVRLSAPQYSVYSPRVSKSPDGKIWFVSLEGVQVFDPAHLPLNNLRPPVHIESIIADDKSYAFKPGMRLPANVHTLRIEFTALSLVEPEKIHFRYKLDGQNKNWHEVINERQATYTNLGPRNYRFRVIACNNSGVWNETGDTLEFSIAPAWNQTTWFYASCVAAFLAMLWGLYRLRLYQIRREFNAQLDGRVDERLRVARELHDTMLQSFQAALIQMQAARNIFARRPEKTEESIDKAINTASGAIAEGRSAIQDLRLHPAGGGDLAELITTAGQELARSEEASGNPPVFAVTVEGARRDVAPLIQDEVYRIARELLRNAFKHAQAGRIEVEIRYDSRQFRLHVRDDGKGIDSEVLKAGGRAGHYGLPGMRERANRFGGKLDFWSEAGAGTEAVLTVPGAAAYATSNGGPFSFFRRKLWIHER